MCVLVHVRVLADMPVSVTYITTILELFGCIDLRLQRMDVTCLTFSVVDTIGTLTLSNTNTYNWRSMPGCSSARLSVGGVGGGAAGFDNSTAAGC